MCDYVKDCSKYFVNGYFTDSGNCLLFTSEYYIIKKLLGLYNEKEDKEQFIKLVRDCYTKDKAGVLHRGTVDQPQGWWNHDQQAHDDYIGVFCACIYLGINELAKEIYEAGSFWRWDNLSPLKPKWKTFFARQLGFTAIAKIAAGKKLNWFDKFSFNLKLLIDRFYLNFPKLANSIKEENVPSGVILSWIMVIAYLSKQDITDGIAKWIVTVSNNGGIPKYLGEYFGNNHPFCVYVRDLCLEKLR